MYTQILDNAIIIHNASALSKTICSIQDTQLSLKQVLSYASMIHSPSLLVLSSENFLEQENSASCVWHMPHIHLTHCLQQKLSVGYRSLYGG
jgi:capsular polysaccharide biosynthesis protein